MLGTGNYGTVSKMRYKPTKQLMAMKVSVVMSDGRVGSGDEFLCILR